MNGGEAGIRTLGTASGTTAFEAAAFNHSATSPVAGYCSRYPDNFFVHILGFGSTQAIEKLEQQIKSVNEKRKKTCCQYHGTLTGDALRDFLHSCEIGVNPQYEGDYMNTAFPSKILSYLTHSLKVVSTEIKSVKLSKVSPFITFAVSDGPKDIAQAIIKAASGDAADCENAVKELDADFAKDIKALIENL